MIVIEHNDDSSQQANACEAVVIEALAPAACEHLRLDPKTGLGIVVPHRAQKVLLQAGVNPTLVTLGAIRRKNRQMKELSDDLFHPRNAQKPGRWLSMRLTT